MKNNIMFFVKFAVAALLVLAILFGINYLYIGGETYAGTYSGMEKFENVPENIRYANFGPSYGMSCFRYDEFEEENVCFNFGLTMQDAYHDFALLKNYEDHLSDDAVVAIPVSYFSFCSNASAPSSSRYYKILKKENIKGYTVENYVSSNYLPVYGKGSSFVRDFTNDAMNAIIKKGMTTKTEEEPEEKSVEAEKLSADSKSRVVVIESGNLSVYQNYIEENENYVVEMIEYVKSKGMTPVMVLTPYWYEYTEGFDKELLTKGFYEPVERIIEKTGVVYMDCNSGDFEDYIHTPEYFNNCDHVSKKGGLEFVRRYMKFLENQGIKS